MEASFGRTDYRGEGRQGLFLSWPLLLVFSKTHATLGVYLFFVCGSLHEELCTSVYNPTSRDRVSLTLLTTSYGQGAIRYTQSNIAKQEWNPDDLGPISTVVYVPFFLMLEKKSWLYRRKRPWCKGEGPLDIISQGVKRVVS